MFGFKLIRTQTFNDIVASYRGAVEIIEQRDQTIREMADDIRSMDQLIYQMSQCTSWDQMRPYFNVLQVSQERRQRNESNRIGGIVRRELLGVYTKEPSK